MKSDDGTSGTRTMAHSLGPDFVGFSSHLVKTKGHIFITDTIPEELSVHMPYSAAIPAASVQLLLL